MYELRFGYIPPDDIGWKYLPAGSGRTLAGYTVKGAGPNKYLLHFLEEGQRFWSRLESSIREEGLRNPPLLIAVEEGTFIRYGASRLWTAKKVGLQVVPAIIADWVGRYTDLELLDGKDAVLGKFRDMPETVDLSADIQILHCPHSHLPGSPTNPGKITSDKYKKMREGRANK